MGIKASIFGALLLLTQAVFGQGIHIKVDEEPYDTEKLDELYQNITRRYSSGTLIAMRCLLERQEYRGGREQEDLDHQGTCDYLVTEMEARGLAPIFPTTAERRRSESNVLMVIEPIRRRR